MSALRSASFLVTGSAVAVAVLFPPAAARAAVQADGDRVLPRTEWGHPDLQGNWTNATVTPLERPAGQGPTLGWEEVARLEGGAQAYLEAAIRPSDPDRPAPPAGGIGPIASAGGGTGGYNSFFIDRGDRVAVVHGEPRSSLITYPPDGRVPPTTEDARRENAERSAFRGRFGAYDHPELRPLGERCVVSFGFSAGPPMLPNSFYNNNYTIVQNEDHVLIMAEMVHDARIIRLGDGPRLPPEMRPWFGDSWGRWEGDTLVVETTNTNPEHRVRGNAPSEQYRVVERFSLMDENTILYRFTVEDPLVWTSPWGGEIPMHRMEPGELLYEYACHEGNYALYNILRGARYEERVAAEGNSR